MHQNFRCCFSYIHLEYGILAAKSGSLSWLQLVFLYEKHVEGKTLANHLGFRAINKRQYTSV